MKAHKKNNTKVRKELMILTKVQLQSIIGGDKGTSTKDKDFD